LAQQWGKYEDHIVRISDLLALVSIVPVIFAVRSAGTTSRAARFPGGRAAAGEEGTEKPPEDQGPSDSLGVSSAGLLLASEALRHRALFIGAKASKKDKGLAGPFGDLLQAVSKASKSVKSSSGMQKFVEIVVNALDSTAAFSAAHGLLMLTSLGVAFTSLLFFVASPKGAGAKRVGTRLLQLMAVAVPLQLFVFFRKEALWKAAKGLDYEGLGLMAPLFLRLLALVMANPYAQSTQPDNREDVAKGTPVWFAAFQSASLTASLFADVASGRFKKALLPILRQWDWSMAPLSLAFDSELCFVILPKIVGVLWLTIAHVRHHFGALFVAVGLSYAASPMSLAKGWPLLVAMFDSTTGKGASKILPEDVLKQLISVTVATTPLPIILSGGSVTLLVLTLLSQALFYAHGQDAVIKAVEALG
jgi:hypothetical protein